MFPELVSEELLISLLDWPCLESIILSSTFQALLFLQDKLLESVWKLWIPSKVCKITGPVLSRINSVMVLAGTVNGVV